MTTKRFSSKLFSTASASVEEQKMFLRLETSLMQVEEFVALARSVLSMCLEGYYNAATNSVTLSADDIGGLIILLHDAQRILNSLPWFMLDTQDTAVPVSENRQLMRVPVIRLCPELNLDAGDIVLVDTSAKEFDAYGVPVALQDGDTITFGRYDDLTPSLMDKIIGRCVAVQRPI